MVQDISCHVSKSDEELVPVDVHHPPLLLMVKSAVKCTNYICGVNTGDNLNFRTADITVLIKGISLIDWSSLNKSTDVNLACEIFYMKLQEVFSSNVPKSIARKHHYPPWFSVDLIKEIKQKSKFWRKYKKYGDKEDYEKFKNLRRVIKVKLAKLYKDYLFKVEGEIFNDPNKFWQFVKYKSNGTDIPFNMSLGNVNYSGPKEIVDAFYEMFKSVFTPVTYNLGNYSKESQSLCQYVSLKSISEQDVIEAIYQLKPKYTAGPDKIPAIVIRDCALSLAEPLTALFNLCLREAKFPDEWKKSKIVPVFKSGDKFCIENYRPVSLINNFGKVFEFIIYKQLFSQLKCYFNEVQHGFFPGRSTVTNLCAITQYISKSIDLNCQTDVIYIDLSKAFDKLDHDLLLSKLSNIGCSPNVVEFFSSYLCRRKQHVFVHGHSSQEFIAHSGVPQGSVLGPLLFNIFINDVMAAMNVPCLLYADDIKIYTTIHGIDDCENLQKNLNVVSDWCELNQLPINKKKSVVMSYGLKNNTFLFNYELKDYLLDRPEVVTDLGVTFDKKLCFSDHIERTVNSSMKIYGYIVRTAKEFSNNLTLIRIFNSFVRSKLEYASVVWFPHHKNHTENLERVLRRFLKYLCYRVDGTYPPVGYSYCRLLERFSFQSLSERNKTAKIIFLYKILNSVFDCPCLLAQISFHINVRAYNTRNMSIFYIEKSRTDVLKYSPLWTMCRLGNYAHNQTDLFTTKISELKKLDFSELP